MIDRKAIVTEPYAPERQQITASLQVHLLGKYHRFFLSLVHRAARNILIHGICPRHFGPLKILDRKGKDRILDHPVKSYLHADLEISIFYNTGSDIPGFIPQAEINDLGILLTIIQEIRIQLDVALPGALKILLQDIRYLFRFFFLGGLLLRNLSVLSYQNLFIDIDDLFRISLGGLYSLVEQDDPSA